MFYYKTNKYTIRLLNKNDEKELYKVQKLRYDHLLKEFNPSLKDGGIDNDGNDDSCDSILVIDNLTNDIVGTYRIATKKTKNGKPFLTESEFNIKSLLSNDFEVLELGRAVVHKNYRDGSVINLLWSAIVQYCLDYDCKYMFGTFSFHGVDPTIYNDVLAYINKHYAEKTFNMFATKDSFEYPTYEIDEKEIIKKIPSLLKAYLSIEATTISKNGFIDYDFKSCDIITLVDISKLNPLKLQFFLRKLKK